MKPKDVWLWPKKRIDQPNTQNVWGFDIETDPHKKNEFLLAVITNGKEKHYFIDIDTLLEFCLTYRPFRSSIFIATNLAYDFLGTFFRNTDRTQIIERDGVFYAAKLKMYDGHTIEFRDTLRYHRISVEKLGKTLGKEKLIDPRSKLDEKGIPVYINGDKIYEYGRPKTKKQWDDLKEYCETDAFISYWFYINIITKWCDEIGIEVKLTMSSIAMEDFRTNYMQHPLKVHSHEHNMLVFKSYYGGHTEAYERGLIKNIEIFDVNSLYPAMMANNWFPQPSKVEYKPLVDIDEIMKLEGCCYIEGMMPNQKYPPLPVKKDGKLYFPIGLIKGWYVFPEIRHAIKCGFELTKIGEGLVYEKRCKPFESFVFDHYARRKEKIQVKDETELMEKNCMNGLYGKFAFQYFHIDSIVTEFEFTPDMYIKYDLVEKTQANGYYRVVCDSNEETPATVIPIWSSYVTAYGRITNNKVCRENGHVVYTDTDSFFVRKKHSSKFPIGTELGLVKKENQQPIKHMLIVRPKLYGIVYADDSSKVKAKGMKTLKKFDQFVKALKHGSVTESRFMKFRQFIKLKKSDKHGDIALNELFKVEKSIDIEDGKREWPRMFEFHRTQHSKPLVFSEVEYQTKDI